MNTWLCVIAVKQILANGARPLFQIVLLLIFLYFFGWPIIETYTKKEEERRRLASVMIWKNE